MLYDIHYAETNYGFGKTAFYGLIEKITTIHINVSLRVRNDVSAYEKFPWPHLEIRVAFTVLYSY